MTPYREVTPLAGPEAFEEDSRGARMSQAAIVLAVGAAVGGGLQRVPEPDALGLPADLDRIERAQPLTVQDAIRDLDIDLPSHLQPALRLPLATSAALARRLVEHPETQTAAALVEASLHSDSPLVRTSAAVAALDTTGPREDVVARLAEGARHRDELTRDLGRTGLARVDPQHAVLRHLAGRPSPLTGTDRPSHTAVLTHGTFAARTTWWQPGGSLFTYLDGLAPPLHMHDPSFGWSGLYSDAARALAADRLLAWTADQALAQPDFFAHSHGGTVANLATGRGQSFERLVLLSWPVHEQWFPDFTRVQRVLDIRVHMDLVILADRGGQTFQPPAAHQGMVASYINGWFDHGATNDPGYWERYDLPAKL